MPGEPPPLRLPPWSVHPDRLRNQLAAIKAALGGPTPAEGLTAASSQWSADLHGDLAQRIRRVIDAIQELDPVQHSFRSGSPYRPADDLGSIKETVVQLRRAWRRRFEGVLGPEKTALLAAFLKRPIADFLGLLECGHNENSHSFVLRWLLDHRCAPHIAPAVLDGLVGVFEDADEWRKRLGAARAANSLVVRREVRIGHELVEADALDRIDLLISGPDFILAIENKVQSVEHNNQTWTYWKWLESLPQADLRGAIFLTPTGIPAGCPGFRPVSYIELAALLLEGPSRSELEPAEDVVIASYFKTLANHVLAREFRAVTADPEEMQ